MTLLEVGGLGGLIAIIVLIMTGPAILLFILAAIYWNKKRETAKKLLIAGVLYLLISGGICGIMVS